MSSRRTCRPNIARLAVLGALALAAGHPAAATAASSAGSSGANGPALSSHAAGQIPTLTNDVGQPGSGAERQLPVGVALATLGLIGLVLGIAMTRATPRASRPRAALRARTS